MDEQFKLDFIGIGASKSGTTWVSDILKEHPEVYYPTERKEINYFNKVIPQDFKTLNYEYEKPITWYHAFFKNRAKGQLCGEITPSYISVANCAQDIFNYNPNIKIFAILRHPVDRLFSEYLFSKQNGVFEYKSLEEAIEKNPMKFINTSMYFENLKRYFDLFKQENIKVFIYEDMKADNRQFLDQLWSFLAVEPYYPETLGKQINVGHAPKYTAVNNFIGKSKMMLHRNGLQFFIPVLKAIGVMKLVRTIKKKNVSATKEREIMDQNLRTKLLGVFREDIERLEVLLSRDLAHWKK